MRLVMEENKIIGEIQHDFSSRYPFLKIEFFEKKIPGKTPARLPVNNSLKMAGRNQFRPGELDIYDTMTVKELEQLFSVQFGLLVQVFRKSGKLWLETTMTDNWTLKQQNEHGEEIAIAFRPKNDEAKKDSDLTRDDNH